MHCTVCWPTALKVPKIFWLWEIHSKEAVSVLYHETFHDAKIVVYDLGEGSQAVGGAGSIATEKAHVNLMYDSLSAEMLHQTNFKPSTSSCPNSRYRQGICKHYQYQHSPDNCQWVVVFFVVDTHYKHWCISTGSRDHHPLSSTLQMSLTNQDGY